MEKWIGILTLALCVLTWGLVRLVKAMETRK